MDDVGIHTCITLENFNQLKEYILKNSKLIKLHQRVMSDTNTVSREISFNNRFIELIPEFDAIKYYQIIIIDEKKEIPVYFISNENDKIRVSAYYNHLDTDDDLINRESDFCKIIFELNAIK